LRLPADAYAKPGTWYFVTMCCRDKRPHFAKKQARDLVQQVLQEVVAACHVEVAVYSILPDHVHFICSAGEKGLPAFVREFKSCTARRFTAEYRCRSPWQARFFDHKVRSDESLQEKCGYVWMNPVRRGLVADPGDYPWSGSIPSG